MDYRAPKNWTYPVPIAYGPGRLAEIAVLCHRAGMTRPLIVTDRGSAALPFIAALCERLADAGLVSGIYSGISPNPRDDEIAAGCEAFGGNGHDGIIAIGGGSGMDGAKAIGLTVKSGVPLWEFDYERPALDVSAEVFPPLITIPTTAGTGAETESTAMITDTGQGMKFCVWHPAYKPASTLLDPDLTVGLPPDLTAWTGCDALVHAIEAYCVPGFHPLCDGAALEGMRLIWRWLEVAVDAPGNLDARGGMLVGSCLAGIAFLKGLGMVHAISHMIGAEYDTQHGLTNAVLLPAVLRFNAPAIADRIEPMAQAMGLRDTGFDAVYAEICGRLDRLQIPRGLAGIGVTATDADIARLAAKALRDSAAGTNPRQATEAEVRALLSAAMTDAR
ncbi:MAG: iron-containing alcohol dehydrogenase [Pseudomonadota bacterium]